jgi:hypothetical protein
MYFGYEDSVTEWISTVRIVDRLDIGCEDSVTDWISAVSLV